VFVGANALLEETPAEDFLSVVEELTLITKAGA